MIEDQDHNNNVSVDRREETLVTRQPGFAATEQVVMDVAAERRLSLDRFNRIMFTILVFLEILLSFRFVLRLIAANPESGFAVLVYGFTGLFTAPFNGLIALPTIHGSLVEVTTLIAMVVYALIFWGILYVVRLIVESPRARSFVRTTREQAPGNAGSVRITHTTISNGNIRR